MSRFDRDISMAELESRYADSDDVAPGDGLDRIVRARADQAVASQRARRKVPWLGVLTSASVAALAVIVVVQLPPSDRAPDVQLLQEDATSSRLEPEGSGISNPARARSGESRAQASIPAPTAAPQAERAAPQSASEAPSGLSDLQAFENEGAAPVAPEPEPETLLQFIREQLEQGNRARARELGTDFKRMYPECELPEDLRSALAEPQPSERSSR